VPDPGAVLQEAARTLKPGGRFVLCDMLPHDREEYKQQMGHVWLGFADDQLRRLFAGAGFDDTRVVPLPVETEAKGPALFVASAVGRVFQRPVAVRRSKSTSLARPRGRAS
jgi:SAM-dependent methyltransferase